MLVRLGNMQVPVPKNTWADQASSAGSVQYAGVLRAFPWHNASNEVRWLSFQSRDMSGEALQ